MKAIALVSSIPL